jgi:hypothetical protein
MEYAAARLVEQWRRRLKLPPGTLETQSYSEVLFPPCDIRCGTAFLLRSGDFGSPRLSRSRRGFTRVQHTGAMPRTGGCTTAWMRPLPRRQRMRGRAMSKVRRPRATPTTIAPVLARAAARRPLSRLLGWMFFRPLSSRNWPMWDIARRPLPTIGALTRNRSRTVRPTRLRSS